MFEQKEKGLIKNLIVLFFVAMFGVIIIQPGIARAAATVAPPVGVVDYISLINQHPDTAKGNAALKAEQEEMKKEFEDKAANLNDQEKQSLNLQLSQQLELKRQELLKPIVEKINVVITQVMEAKGLTIVVQKNSVVCGGQDITNEVLKKIMSK
ncbi:OmpH family outer membrane protein [Pelosinus propionicus]|nr:OmpH family outer membrane protein [Pelosinus propionicus]